VTITTATPGATIYYTTDGGEPTVGSIAYSGPFVVSADTTVKAFAVKTGMADSPTATAAYKIIIEVVNQAPVVVSGPLALPETPFVNQTVAFTVAAVDPDGDPLQYEWSFGDGNSALGAQPTHAYMTAGTYLVTVAVTDGKGGSTETSLILIVTDDEDDDGQAAKTPEPLTVVKGMVALNFKKGGADSITVSGLLSIPEGFLPADMEVGVEVGGVKQNFTLETKGRSKKQPNAKFQLSLKYKKSVLTTGPVKFALQLRKGDFQATLTDKGLANATMAETKQIVVMIVTSNKTYAGVMSGLYKAKENVGGKLTAKK
jgi:PKD repeat protein